VVSAASLPLHAASLACKNKKAPPYFGVVLFYIHYSFLRSLRCSGVSAPRYRGCSPPINGGDMEGVMSLLNREGLKNHWHSSESTLYFILYTSTIIPTQ